MDSKVNYTIVGLFVILLGATLVVLIFWLTSLKHREVYDVYIVYMHEEVSGLSVQSPVRYNGVKVGYVQSIQLNPKDPQQVMLVLKIQEGTPITTSTIATLMAEGITGLDYIGLKALTAEAPPLEAKPGEKYPVIPSEPSLLLKLSTALQEVTKTVGDLSANISKVFDEKNREAIRQSLANTAKITSTIAQNSKNIDAIMVSTKKLLTNSAQASKDLPDIMKQLKATLASVKAVANKLNNAGSSVVVTMRDTRTAVQNVSQQLVPSTQQLLTQLNDVAGNLQQLSAELQHNPSILVRGKYPSPPGPGEK
ncbi:MlaD family protein [Candidiatus Paracoxiella cheracis]|uniref:MlaD family protein n=1 Tax=Candidiatus Paracoxiella cheracis TaxID=3405120 RepID=UPI003BF61BDD